MKLTAETYAQALYDALNQTKEDSHEEILNTFVSILHRNGDLALSNEIFLAFERLSSKLSGQSETDVTLMQGTEVSRNVWDTINQQFGTSKSHVTTISHEDILGGVVVTVGDQELDMSLKTQLEELRKAIIS